MKIFEIYLLRQLVKNSTIVIIILTSIFCIFNLLSEIDEIGLKSYTFGAAIIFTISKIPEVLSQVFISGILIGSIISIGIMGENRELLVLGSGHISNKNIAVKFVKYGFVISFFLLIFIEIFSPSMITLGEKFKAGKLEKSYEVDTGNNFWLKKGTKYINIGENFLPRDLKSVLVVDTDKKILSLSKSNSAELNGSILVQNNAEIYEEIIENNLSKIIEKPRVNMLTELDIESDFLKPEQKNSNIINLFKKIYSDNKFGLNTKLSETELYSRILKPIYLVIILLLALPYVFKFSRTQSISKKIFFGVLIGLVFNLFLKFFNVISMKLSIDTSLFFSMLILLLLLISIFSFQRKFINI